MAIGTAFAEIDHGDGELPADGDALDEAQQDQQDRGKQTDAGIGRKKADGE
jgi:hypothetical protein